jgi:hypothetical protein
MTRQEVLALYACVWAIGESALLGTWAVLTIRLRRGTDGGQSRRVGRMEGIRDIAGLLALIGFLILLVPVYLSASR